MNLKQEIGERIHELQRKSGKSIELWSLEYGINVNKFYSYKYGRAEPDSNFYKKLAENGVDMFWLFTGAEPNVVNITMVAEKKEEYRNTDEVLILQARLEECRELVTRLSGNVTAANVLTNKTERIPL